MFTGNFATGTTALGGNGREINFYLVGVFAATLAFAPECFGVLSKLSPGFGDCEFPGVFGGAAVGSECEYLIGR